MADENVDRPIVHWLREQGHDVLEVSVAAPGVSDRKLIEASRSQSRVLVTFDRDIGRILRTTRQSHPGVAYLRLRGVGPALWSAFEQVWPTVQPVVAGHFVTVRNRQVRCRPLPLE